MLRPGRAGADVAADAARTGAFLGALFAHACGDGGRALAGNAWLAAGVARLAGDYAAWLGGPGAGAQRPCDLLPRKNPKWPAMCILYSHRNCSITGLTA